MSIEVFDERQFSLYDWVYKPSNTSPSDGETDIGETPTLELDGFYSLYDWSQSDSQFQISTSSNFDTTVVDTTNDVSTTYQVTSGVLSTDTTYYWRGKLQDEDGNWSEWSDSTSFVTASEFVDYENDIGTSTDGGYNAGTITYNATDYAIIVSPKAEGESSQIEWSSDINTEYDCTDNDDGKSNTDCMLDNDTSLDNDTATEFIDDVRTNGINGYNDWYIPAINELQMMYENMYKADKNETLSGTDWYDNGETFEHYLYWSSTEHSSTRAYSYNFSNGTVYDNVKDRTRYVRAVRRVSL